MYTADDFKQAYEDYAQYNRDLIAKIGPMGGIAGVLGFGKRPGNDPGHMAFLNDMESVLKQVVEEKPDPETAGEIMDVIFHARTVYADEKISPYVFTAVEGMTIDMIPFLTADKVRDLYEEYRKTPRSLRVPVMTKVLSALKDAANR